MVVGGHRTHIHIDLTGEGEVIGQGRLLRKADSDAERQDISSVLSRNPTVRALLLRPNNPAIRYPGTQDRVYRSNNRGSDWEALNGGTQGNDVWSMTVHPNNPNVIFAGF